MNVGKLYAVVCLCALAPPAFAGVTVASPGSGSTSGSPVHFVASGTSACSKGVAAMGIYTAPYVLAHVTSGSKLDTNLNMNLGTYNAVVQQWDNCGQSSKVAITIHVAQSASSVPRSNHVWIITEENYSYESVIGNSQMPYYNSLANKYALAAQYYSNRHSSLPALMWLVAGQGVTTNNNTTSCFNVDNVVRHLLYQGMTWKSYQEDLPYAGCTGLSWAYYLRRHNPLIDFVDVCAPSQKLNSVPFSQLAKDISNNATPNYVYISPTFNTTRTMERLRKPIRGSRNKFPRYWLALSFSPAETGSCSSFGMRAPCTPIIAAAPLFLAGVEGESPHS